MFFLNPPCTVRVIISTSLRFSLEFQLSVVYQRVACSRKKNNKKQQKALEMQGWLSHWDAPLNWLFFFRKLSVSRNIVSLHPQCLLWWGEVNEPSKWVKAAATLRRHETDIEGERAEGGIWRKCLCGARFKAVGSKQLNHYDWNVWQPNPIFYIQHLYRPCFCSTWNQASFIGFISTFIFFWYLIWKVCKTVFVMGYIIVSADIRWHVDGTTTSDWHRCDALCDCVMIVNK